MVKSASASGQEKNFIILPAQCIALLAAQLPAAAVDVSASGYQADSLLRACPSSIKQSDMTYYCPRRAAAQLMEYAASRYCRGSFMCWSDILSCILTIFAPQLWLKAAQVLAARAITMYRAFLNSGTRSASFQQVDKLVDERCVQRAPASL